MTLIIMWYQNVCNCRQYCFDLVRSHQCSTAYIPSVPRVTCASMYTDEAKKKFAIYISVLSLIFIFAWLTSTEFNRSTYSLSTYMYCAMLWQCIALLAFPGSVTSIVAGRKGLKEADHNFTSHFLYTAVHISIHVKHNNVYHHNVANVYM